MNGNVFFDTNILVYAVASDDPRNLRADILLQEGGYISVQVLNELANVARRKQGREWAGVREILSIVREFCIVLPLTEDVHERGLALSERHSFSAYDGMIVAAAQLAGCSTLYSEDKHDGFAIEGLSIINPFK